MSELAWIDFDEKERARAQRIMALLQERESRDELGLGSIRDSLADHLFPGTSTIQTRLRYMLFIPWLFRMVETRNAPEDQLRAETRAHEVRLVNALKAGGEISGVIGRAAGARLQQMPSAIYWAGLGAWGVRLFPGSIESLFVSLRGRKRLQPALDGEDAIASPQTTTVWSQPLPSMPKNLLDQAVFQLTMDEAQYLIDRLVASQPDSLLTLLAREKVDAKCDQIWMHPLLSSFPQRPRRLVEHAAVFSDLMHGAALLYNLTLSELRKEAQWTDDYQGLIAAWRSDIDLSAVRAWSLDDFWGDVQHPAHTIRPPAKRFVSEWRDLVLGNKDIASSLTARQLVEQRERRLKLTQSRYANHTVRDRWTGASGADRLGYRWRQARSHLTDLAHAG